MDESVEAGSSLPDNPLGIEQIHLEAQNQWLSQAPILGILQNHEKFGISSELPNKPPSGSLFLFDKKVQRHFRNDGHNWKKKKDGKTLLEGHQTLKNESFGDLDCYYAHGEENRNFQRRSYWMRKGDFSHVAFVHYLEVMVRIYDLSYHSSFCFFQPSSKMNLRNLFSSFYF
ncbi:hypothetical protein SLEP1_g56548 [Rubroshorea leprosula]|uniref:CG-1 domain-containing protein n=1 Tax=Rubroshorea leprosula TaxID=152421 RepID=A0AAV5MJX8_9ROSI|nr:hypothetical protein SLEP1_g56548 [Rubroshorea leprosula]